MPTAVAGPEIERLIQLLARLPGLGPRSARRAALHLIKKREALMAPLAAALRRRKILVRHFPQSVFSDALRISIGLPAEMRQLFNVLPPLLKPMLKAKRDTGRDVAKSA